MYAFDTNIMFIGHKLQNFAGFLTGARQRNRKPVKALFGSLLDLRLWI
jgi:hypothetical protein